MLDKMKDIFDIQKKMQEMKRQLEAAIFEVASTDGVVKITMNGSQEIKEIKIQGEASTGDSAVLESAVKDALNRAIKRSHEIAAQKMKEVTGLNLPGLW